MRLSKRGLLAGVIGGLLSPAALGLGLGEVDLRSNLNQPLAADIRLLQVRDLGEAEILVSLAAKEDFERAGVERPFFLTELKFKVDLSNPNNPIIRVTSRKPVLEPFLNFLVEIQWPTGRVVREYTLLMDLPVFAEDQSAVAVPVPTAAQPSPNRQVVTTYTQAPAEPLPYHPGMAPSSEPGTYGPIGADDTLWEIALKVRPSRSVSVQQTMLAIHRKNPNAFIRGNINLIKRGSVLRVPTEDEIVRFQGDDAIREVASHNKRFRGEGDEQYSAAPLEGASRDVDTDYESEDAGRLKLLAPGDTESQAAGRGAGAAGGDAEALQTELAVSQEELDRSRRENTDLRSHVSDLEAQIQTMEKLLSVSDEKLRALELKLKVDGVDTEAAIAEAGIADEEGELRDALAEQESAMTAEEAQDITDSLSMSELSSSDEDTVAEVAKDEASAEMSPEASESAEQEAQVTAAQSQSEKQPANPQPVKPAPKPMPQPGIVDMLMDNLMLILGGLIAILVAIGGFIWKRKQEEGFDFDEELDQNEELDDVELDFAGEPEMSDDVVEGVEEDEIEGLEEMAEDAGAEDEESDPLSYADVYIAYGKFDEAEDKLQSAIEQEPDRSDLRLKLLEVHTESGNLNGFDTAYAQLLGLNDSGANTQAASLRDRFSDAAPFDADAFGVEIPEAEPTAESGGELEDLDFGFDMNELESGDDQTVVAGDQVAGDQADETSEEAEEEFDLDGLDLDFSGEAGEEDGELNLDFDLEGSEDTADSSESEESLIAADEDLELGEDLSFDLDGDLGGELPEEESSNEANLDLGGELSEEFSLELEGDTSEGTSVESLDEDLDLDLGSLDESSEETTSPVEEAASAEAEDELAALDAELDLSDLEAPAESGEDNFDFDSDLGDLDLSELDAELDDFHSDEESSEPTLDSLDSELGAGLDAELGGDNDSADLELGDLDLGDNLGELASEIEAEEAPEAELDLSSELETDLSVEESSVVEGPGLEALEEAIGEDALSLDVEGSAEDELATEGGLDFDLAETDLGDVDLGDSDLSEVSLGDFNVDSETPTLVSEEGLDLDIDGLDEELSMEAPEAEESAEDLGLEDLGAELALAADDLEATDEADPLEEDSSLDDLGAELEMAAPEESADEDGELSDEDEFSFLSDSDEVATKLDLARAYLDMGDIDGAKEILQEVTEEGNDEQQSEAKELLERANA
ncbi:MAG: hypothetical protein K6L73_12780 [Cellvibrionaceae bacterium]